MERTSLEQFVKEVNGESHLRVEKDYGDGFVRLCTSEAERRQAAQDIKCSEDIVLELMRNSLDAHASHIFVSMTKEGDTRKLVVIDDGEGIPAHMHEHVFEPRVTSKLDTSHRDRWGYHGRGMALYSISQAAKTAHVVASERGIGCSICTESSTKNLSEKADQSTFPRFEMAQEGVVNIRGPRNIYRTACEFAIEVRNSCTVFIGSPAEIASTLYSYGKTSLTAIERAFTADYHEFPLVKRLAACADVDEFAQCSDELGIGVSSRTARRIFDGEIEPLKSILNQVAISNGAQKKHASRTNAASDAKRRIRISSEDQAEFARDVKSAFAKVADRYYLESDVEPVAKAGKSFITVKVPLTPKSDDD